jgi:HAD superfamily hydrolase (TIGR01549 family)
MNGFAAALFDLDGTLIYSKGVIGRCINETLEHFGCLPFEKNELHDLIGIPLGKALAQKTEDIKPLIEYFRKLYLQTYMNGTWVFDEMVPVLATLKQEKKKIGVVTLKSTPVAMEVLKGLNLSNYIDAVEGDDDVSELKPSPSHVIRLCRKLDIEPHECLVIGDTTMDITAGRNAKCKTIGVLWGAMSLDELESSGVDYLARNPMELKDLLERI